MFRILILLVLGVGVGYMLRGRSFVGVTKWSIQITVCVLLFVFGVWLFEYAFCVAASMQYNKGMSFPAKTFSVNDGLDVFQAIFLPQRVPCQRFLC